MSNIKIKDEKLEIVLLNAESAKNVATDFQKQYENIDSKRHYGERALASFLTFAANLVPIISSYNSISVLAKVILIIIDLVLVVYSIVYTVLFLSKKREFPGLATKPIFEQMLMDKARESVQYTAVMRVTHKTKGNETRYMVSSDCFLPHCNLNPDNGFDEQTEDIAKSLWDRFGVERRDVLLVRPSDGKVHFSIKKVHGEEQINAFVFYDIKIALRAMNSLITETKERKWMTLNNMRNTAIAVERNMDVIKLLQEGLPSCGDSFTDTLDVERKNIIWNITSKCRYNCSFCATYDTSKKELDSAKKFHVLNQILTAKEYIRTIDFAGGDPLIMSETVDYIRNAVNTLGSERVYVTTTGEGASSRFYDQFPSMMQHCEITIDAAHDNLSNSGKVQKGAISRQEKNYCAKNEEEIDKLVEHAKTLTVNIPIVNDDLSDEEVDVLCQKILKIGRHNPSVKIEALLIRLMPVGKLPLILKKEEYEKYNPIPVIEKIQSKLKEHGIECKLHCSLRVLPHFDNAGCNHCTMLENKLGIDCAGNVYACAWGGYIGQGAKNPFYLGNLLRTDLKKIIEGSEKSRNYNRMNKEIENNQHRHFCSVISHYAEGDPYKDSDYLSSK